MARKFKNDHRAKSIRKQTAWQRRNGTPQERIRANIIDKEFDELMTMVDEEIERIERQHSYSPLTSEGFLNWLPDDFDDDESESDND